MHDHRVPNELPARPTKPAPEFLTTSEIADKLRVCDNTVRRLCQTKALAAFKVGAVWRVRSAAFDAYLLSLAGPRP